MQCAFCKHFSLKYSPLAKHQYGECSALSVGYMSYKFYSALYERVCKFYLTTEGEDLRVRNEYFGVKNGT